MAAGADSQWRVPVVFKRSVRFRAMTNDEARMTNLSEAESALEQFFRHSGFVIPPVATLLLLTPAGGGL
jgi:hypothetical protein